MLELYAFYLLALFIVLSALVIFVQKRLIRAVIALTIVFGGSALVFVLLSQTLIAILMMIVFVGGFSTYLVVAVAAEEKNAKLITFPYFATVAIIFFAVTTVMLAYLPTQASATGPNFLSIAASAFHSNYTTLYIIVILLFSATLGGTLILKRFSRLIV